MGWKEVTMMFQRKEFVMLAMQTDNFSELCERFGISRKTGYKFVNRYCQEGEAGLCDHYRRPKRSPHATSGEIERLILALRKQHPAWGPRKLKQRLENLGHVGIPAASTIGAILKRRDQIDPLASQLHKAWQRFEAQAPNDLWQMDFKGPFSAREGVCHPLTLLDDHARYCLELGACEDKQKQTVEHRLKNVFRRYGLPWAILLDNGAPWGHDLEHPYTTLTVWMMRLSIRVIHSAPYHPQTLGKDERFHRTLKAEVISECIGRSLRQCQNRFDHWRMVYNTQRPHEALDMQVPASRYQISQRPFPEKLPEIEYAPTDSVRKVQDGGFISFLNQPFRVGKAFKGQPVAVRATDTDGKFEVLFCHQKIAQINLSS